MQLNYDNGLTKLLDPEQWQKLFGTKDIGEATKKSLENPNVQPRTTSREYRRNSRPNAAPKKSLCSAAISKHRSVSTNPYCICSNNY